VSAASLASVRDNGNARRVRLANYCTATVITDVIMRVRGLFVKTAECRRHSRLNNTKVPTVYQCDKSGRSEAAAAVDPGHSRRPSPW